MLQLGHDGEAMASVKDENTQMIYTAQETRICAAPYHSSSEAAEKLKEELINHADFSEALMYFSPYK